MTPDFKDGYNIGFSKGWDDHAEFMKDRRNLASEWIGAGTGLMILSGVVYAVAISIFLQAGFHGFLAVCKFIVPFMFFLPIGYIVDKKERKAFAVKVKEFNEKWHIK